MPAARRAASGSPRRRSWTSPGRVAVVGEAGAALARHVDLVVHDAARAAELRRNDDQVHAPLGVQVGRRVAHRRSSGVQIAPTSSSWSARRRSAQAHSVWSCDHGELPAVFGEDGVEELCAAGAIRYRRGTDGARQRVDLERGAAEEPRHPRERHRALVHRRPRTAVLRRTAPPSARTGTAPALSSLSVTVRRRRVRERALELAGRRLCVVELLGDDGELAFPGARDEHRRRHARHLEIRVVTARAQRSGSTGSESDSARLRRPRCSAQPATLIDIAMDRLTSFVQVDPALPGVPRDRTDHRQARSTDRRSRSAGLRRHRAPSDLPAVCLRTSPGCRSV